MAGRIRQASWRRHLSQVFGDGYKINGWRRGAGPLGEAAPEASGTDGRRTRPFRVVSLGGWSGVQGQRTGRGQLCEAGRLAGVLQLGEP